MIRVYKFLMEDKSIIIFHLIDLLNPYILYKKMDLSHMISKVMAISWKHQVF